MDHLYNKTKLYHSPLFGIANPQDQVLNPLIVYIENTYSNETSTKHL